MREPRWIKVGSYLVLVVASFIAVLPAFWVFVSSFKVESEVFSTKVELVGPQRHHLRQLRVPADARRLPAMVRQLGHRGRGRHRDRRLPGCDGGLRPVALPVPWPQLVAVRLPRGADVPRHHPAGPALQLLHQRGPHRPAPSVIIAYSHDRDPLLRAHAEGLLRHHPLSTSRRLARSMALGVFGWLLAHRPAALGPRRGRDGLLQLRDRLERVHAGQRLPRQPRQADAAGRASRPSSTPSTSPGTCWRRPRSSSRSRSWSSSSSPSATSSPASRPAGSRAERPPGSPSGDGEAAWWRRPSDDRSRRAMSRSSSDAQTESGAILACPTYPPYRYAWLRDGSFCAVALDRAGQPAPAWRFHGWVAARLRAHEARDAPRHRGAASADEPRSRRRPALSLQRRGPGPDGRWLGQLPDGRTRALAVGAAGARRAARGGGRPVDEADRASVWRSPRSRTWCSGSETSCAAAVAAEYVAALWSAAVLRRLGGARRPARHEHPGRLPRGAPGRPTVWASNRRARLMRWRPSAPSSPHAAVAPASSLAPTRTGRSTPASSGARSLLGAVHPDIADVAGDARAHRVATGGLRGGVHRYVADEFYGGGQWPVLAAAHGLACLQRGADGDLERARRAMGGSRPSAAPSGELPEQSSTPAAASRPARHLAAPLGPGGLAAELVARHGHAAPPRAAGGRGGLRQGSSSALASGGQLDGLVGGVELVAVDRGARADVGHVGGMPHRLVDGRGQVHVAARCRPRLTATASPATARATVPGDRGQRLDRRVERAQRRGAPRRPARPAPVPPRGTSAR